MPSKTNKRSVYVLTPILTATGAGQTANLDLDAGHYYVSMIVTSSLTGTTTTVALAALNSVNSPSNEPYELGAPDDTVALAALDLPAGASVRAGACIPVGFNVPVVGPVAVSGGLRVTVVNGTAVSGEQLEIEVIATKV